MKDAYKIFQLEPLEGELWLPVVGWEEFYNVSNFGRVYSKRKNIILKSSDVLGYRQVILCTKGEMYSGRVQRLVAKAFIPNPENKPFVNHIDGVRDNNHVPNLEWATPSENTKHTYDKLGRMPVNGIRSNFTKLSESQVREIRSKYVPRKYPYARLGLEYGVDKSTIHLLIKGRNWKHLI